MPTGSRLKTCLGFHSLHIYTTDLLWYLAPIPGARTSRMRSTQLIFSEEVSLRCFSGQAFKPDPGQHGVIYHTSLPKEPILHISGLLSLHHRGLPAGVH